MYACNNLNDDILACRTAPVRDARAKADGETGGCNIVSVCYFSILLITYILSGSLDVNLRLSCQLRVAHPAP